LFLPYHQNKGHGLIEKGAVYRWGPFITSFPADRSYVLANNPIREDGGIFSRLVGWRQRVFQYLEKTLRALRLCEESFQPLEKEKPEAFNSWKLWVADS
jgi:hypothetical protein